MQLFTGCELECLGFSENHYGEGVTDSISISDGTTDSVMRYVSSKVFTKKRKNIKVSVF